MYLFLTNKFLIKVLLTTLIVQQLLSSYLESESELKKLRLFFCESLESESLEELLSSE